VGSDDDPCREFRDALPGVLDEDQPVNLVLVRHVDSCLACQAEVAKYRRLLRALRGLRTRYLEPAPDLLAQTLAGLGEASERRVVRSMLTGKRIAYTSAIAGGAAAIAGGAAAVAIVARSRRRQGRSG
jgi:anti-sigma factor RsiW